MSSCHLTYNYTVDYLKRASLYIFYFLLAYMPFHIFLSTWLGTSLGVLEGAKIAKDVLLVVGSVLAFAPSVRQKWFKQLLKDRLVQLILAYAALTVLLAAIKPADPDAEILGVAYNTRFLLFFLYAVLLTHLFNPKQVLKQSIQVVLAASVIVLLFGIVQYTFLPNNALSHVGYSRQNGVVPAFFIDDKPDLERVMSTLRDPNSLGSYVIIIGSLALAGLLKLKSLDAKKAAKGLLVLGGLCLWFTFSRSAWLGYLLAVAVLFGLMGYQKKKLQLTKTHVFISLVALLLVTSTVVAVRNTYFVKNVVFHADESTVLEDPNQLRTRFWQESAKGIVANPIGSGPGTAGLASIKNEKQGTILNESYYLQIGTEIGVVGLGIFLAILALCCYRLWGMQGTVAAGLFASLVGLVFTNALVHIWSNEAVAYTWWGLAGLIMATRSQIVRGKTGGLS